MQYSRRIFFSDDISDSFPEDDIDKLFSKLEKVEPPQAVIDSILSTTSKLPRPLPPGTVLPTPPVPNAPLIVPETTETPGATETGDGDQQAAMLWSTLDGLVVRRERAEPS